MTDGITRKCHVADCVRGMELMRIKAPAQRPPVIETTRQSAMKVRQRMSQHMFDTSPRTPVRRQMLLAAAGSLIAIPAIAAQLVEVDEKEVGEAYRASKLVGASVVNDKNEKIGSIDDLIVTPTDRVLFAVISVGGFLGINNRLVAVPYSSLQIDDRGRKVVLPGATKDALSKLPAFHYA